MLRKVKISTKILTVMLVTSLSALLVITVISYTQMINLTTYSEDANTQLGITSSTQSRQALLDQAQPYLQKIVVEQANGFNATLTQVQTEIAGMRDYMQALYADPKNFSGSEIPAPAQTAMGVASPKYILAPGVSAASVAGELRLVSNAKYEFAGVLANDANLDNTYLGTATGISYRYSRSNAVNANYDPRERSWYKQAAASPDKVVWVDTYLDPYGSICVTCAAAYKGSDGQIAGVVATDITLKSMQQSILATKIGEGGYAFLLDNKAAYIVHPDYQTEGFNTEPLKTATGDWKTTLETMASGKTGVSRTEIDGKEYYVAYAPLNCTSWALGVTVPIDTVTAPADATKKEIDQYTDEAQTHIRDTLSDVLMRFIILFALCTVVFVVFAFVLSRTITNPIQKLVKSAERMGSGDLDTEIPVEGKDEIADLATAFNGMAKNLKAYIADFTAAEAEKERIGTELAVAGNIQDDMLPHIFPTFSELPQIAIFAKMIPAKAVGGDFYDCFFLNPEQTRLCAVIADVSGKGVPASLFMVIAKTLIKTNILAGSDPAEAVNRVNDLLNEDNSSCMFVTAFVCIIDTEKNELTYINCGHNPPLLGNCEKGFHFMQLDKTFPLAIFPGNGYLSHTTAFGPGDVLYLYTDGITEASNEAGALFGNEALHQTLNNAGTSDPETLDNIVRGAAADFVAGAEQADDMTTLVIYFKTREA